jgi:signal peptidase II
VKRLMQFGLVLVSYGFDRLTKLWAMQLLDTASITLFPWLDLLATWNRGVSWSLFSSHDTTKFIILTACIAMMICILAFYTVTRARKNEPILSELLVIAGALGNMTDRFLYGAVFDFIDLHVADYHWPVFNIADIFIVVGVGGMLVRSMRR